MKKSNYIFGALVASSLLSSWAFAQEQTQTATNVSTADVKQEEVTGAFKLPVDLAYRLELFGSQLSGPTNDFMPTDSMSDLNNTAAQDPIWSRHTLTVGRDLGKGFNISINPQFKLVHTDPGANGARGFLWNDSYLKLAKGDLLSAKIGNQEIGLAADIRYYAPTSHAAIINSSYGSVRASIAPSIQLSNRFSLESGSYIKAWMLSRPNDINSGAALNNIELYTSVQFNAQITQSVKAWVLYEAITNRATDGEWSNGSNPRFAGRALTDLEPGVDIQLGEHFTVSPFLNWYPTLPVSTTTWNLALTASM